jgi:hypothetical protein
MMAKRSRGLICIFVAAFLVSALLPVSLHALQSEMDQESQAVAKESKEEAHEVIVPAPKDKKEEIGIYIFLAWIWLSIFVLIYVLRLKVKESDRIYEMKFFSKDEE